MSLVGDLNIEHYTTDDLKDMFGLTPTSTYTEADLISKEITIQQHLGQDSSLDVTLQQQIRTFLFQARMKLQQSMNTTPYTATQPSEFYAGTLNPLSKRILSQSLTIDSRFRTPYYSTNASNFHVSLPLSIHNVVSMELTAMEMPTTFYCISKSLGNHFFQILVSNSDTSIEPLMVYVPDGSYDFLSFQNFLNTYLANQTVNSIYTSLSFLIDMNTPNNTTGGGSGKMIIGSTSGTLAFSLNFQTNEQGNDDVSIPLPLKLGWIMGFRQGIYTASTTYVSEGMVDLLGPKYAFLVVDDFHNNVHDGFVSAYTDSILNKNILARISLRGSLFNQYQIHSSNVPLSSNVRTYFGPVDIQKLQIQLLDEYGRILFLNNMDYSFCVQCQTIYQM